MALDTALQSEQTSAQDGQGTEHGYAVLMFTEREIGCLLETKGSSCRESRPNPQIYHALYYGHEATPTCILVQNFSACAAFSIAASPARVTDGILEAAVAKGLGT